MAPEFRSRPDGTKYPLRNGGGGGPLVAVGVFAIAAAGGGGVAGTAGITGAGASAAETAVVRGIGQNLGKATKQVRAGKPQQAWRTMRLQRGSSLRDTAECALISFGEVQEFLVQHGCRDIGRVQFPLTHEGGTMSVLVSEVRLRSAGDAREFKARMDEHGTGDIRPISPRPAFTGEHYDSARRGSTVLVAEAEPAAGSTSEELLDTTAEAAVALARAVS
ncbi:hypothetical protein IQ251_05815 [Saccharopolyspora sp. HNM0983]|uniref:Uncharacterized protein n=1 Tax=Saccharopolyspora montiporae TaxID=2781240 RepID=A0A929B8U8_9PSEU|nr:hypothetical protein [Saccharopolyspora sp. HNM0983]MBE9373960.1 hypothetical protein [Saccharopolyspora sp. HNM0983]